MTTNYYTIVHVVRELQTAIAGKTIGEFFSQQRGELVVAFVDSSTVVVIGCEPSKNFILTKKNYSRTRKNSFEVFPSLSNVVLKSVNVHPNDRVVTFHLANNQRVIAELFGSKANVVLVDEANKILGAFLKKKILTGQNHEERPPISTTVSIEQFKQAIILSDQSLSSTLKKLYPKLGTVLIRECLHRTGISDETAIGALTENEFQRLFDSIEKLLAELTANPSPRIYFEENTPVCFSIIPLLHLRELHVEEFASVSEALQFYLASEHREKHFEDEKQVLVKAIEREAEQTARTLEKLAEEKVTAQQVDEFERFGKLLTSQLHNINKGDREAVVEDILSGTNELTSIPLDIHLNPAKNAERYFEKSKKLRRTAEEQAERISELSHQQQSLSNLLTLLDEITTRDELKQFLFDHEDKLSTLGIKTTKSGTAKKEQPLPFRVFTVAGGFQVWAGKSSENNDLLTTRHTAKNDLWFHARGVGGSHVVLKIGTGKGEVSKQAIAQAAGIAAHYSKMKNASMVPVTMCEGKFVRKPKGVPAGTVYVEREQTIFAEPALPDNAPSEN